MSRAVAVLQNPFVVEDLLSLKAPVGVHVQHRVNQITHAGRNAGRRWRRRRRNGVNENINGNMIKQ